jgi:4-hydroxy-tetrahydrodipicolinate reductase
MIKLALIGSAGRMGREVLKVVSYNRDFAVVAAVEMEGHPLIGKDAGMVAGLEPSGVTISEKINEEIRKAEAVVDFSSKQGTSRLLDALINFPLPSVIGTTGLDEETIEKAKQVSLKCPILMSPNLSYGVAVLKKLVALATKILANFDIEVIEIHHRKKLDSPSGTAKVLLEIISKSKEEKVSQSIKYGRKGGTCPRETGEIGVHSLRGGTVTGEHKVLFLGDGERIEIGHIAETREIFARGALQAVKWLIQKKPGLYSMDNLFE